MTTYVCGYIYIKKYLDIGKLIPLDLNSFSPLITHVRFHPWVTQVINVHNVL